MPNATWEEIERVNAMTLIRKLAPKEMVRTSEDRSVAGAKIAAEIRKKAEDFAYAHTETETKVNAQRTQPGNTKGYAQLVREARREFSARYHLPDGLTWSEQERDLANRLVDGKGEVEKMIRNYSESLVLVVRGIPGHPDYERGFPMPGGRFVGNWQRVD